MDLFIDLAATDAAVAAIRGAIDAAPTQAVGFVGGFGVGPARLSEAIAAAADCRAAVPEKIELIASAIESGAAATRAADVLLGLAEAAED